MAEIGVDIERAAYSLKKGDVIGMPTETVYGLAGNALDENAVLKIYEVKNRPKFDPIIAHTYSIDKVQEYVESIPQKAADLAEAFWPGPMTLLLKRNSIIPDILTSGLPYVAVRIPKHDLTLELLKHVDFPLAAPSANPFGYISPTTAAHVSDQLGNKIPYILEGGACSVGLESTIIGFDANQNPVIHRLGGMKVEEIEKVVGKVKLKLNVSSNPLAPGMLKTHYAPSKRLYIGQIPDLISRYPHMKLGIISFKDTYPQVPIESQMVLSEKGDLGEAAKSLFGALRKMDQMEIDFILTQRFPEEGLGRAINDRLKRAAYQ